MAHVNKFMRIKNIKNQKGFTLIELLVATSIFTVVALAGIAILVSSQRVYKRISGTRVATDNINLVLDTMSREIKFGSKYSCVNVPSINQNFSPNSTFNYSIPNDSNGSDCDAIAFIPQSSSSSKILYYFNKSTLSINEADYVNDVLQKDLQMTSSELKIDTFWLKISGASTDINNSLEPKVIIFASGLIDTVKNNQGIVVATTTFDLQTTISQRGLDN